MKRIGTIVAAPLLALVAAIFIRQILRARESSGPAPSGAAKTAAEVKAVTDDSASYASREPSAPAPEPAATVTASTSLHLRPLGDAIEMSYASTLAAFALLGEEADYETHDAKAQQDAERLQQLFSSMHADLPPDLSISCEAIIDRIAAAQLQLMAFAINRKNRGLPDSAQAEAELADRKAFEDDAEPLFARVKAALSTAGVE